LAFIAAPSLTLMTTLHHLHRLYRLNRLYGRRFQSLGGSFSGIFAAFIAAAREAQRPSSGGQAAAAGSLRPRLLRGRLNFFRSRLCNFAKNVLT
jgi:hypothetical protein